jgi:hypothetical protein
MKVVCKKNTNDADDQLFLTVEKAYLCIIPDVKSLENKN